MILKKILYFLFIAFFIVVNASTDEREYMDILTKTFQACEQEGEKIWPGFQLNDQPMIFFFNNGNQYAFGCTPSDPSKLPPFHPNFQVNGKEAFVINLDYGNDTRFLPLFTFVHERFHLHQFAHFYIGNVLEGNIEDYQNIDQLAWIAIEDRLLYLYLKTKNKDLLKDFIALNKTRRGLLHSSSIGWEDHQQKMEGLADYVSIRTFQIANTMPQCDSVEWILKMREKKSSQDTFRNAFKGRHYFVGATLAIALDDCKVNWKSRIEKEDISFADLLEELFPMNEKELKKRAYMIKNGLGWSGARSLIKQKLEEEEEKQKKILSQFEGQEGVEVYMGTPKGHMSSAGRHKLSCQISERKALIEDTSLASSQDQSWTLRFNAFPLLFEDSHGDRLFKLEINTSLEVNGQKTTLKNLLQGLEKEIFFSTLALKEPHCELTSTRPGMLSVDQGKIHFKFF